MWNIDWNLNTSIFGTFSFNKSIIFMDRNFGIYIFGKFSSFTKNVNIPSMMKSPVKLQYIYKCHMNIILIKVLWNLFRDNPTSLFWELVFTGDQPSLSEKQILDIIYKDLPHYYYKDSEGVVIGDIFIHINDYATTKLPMDLQILNLTWSDELMNPNSFMFQQYSADLCRDVRNICLFSTYKKN